METCKTCGFCQLFYVRYLTYGKRKDYCCTLRDEVVDVNSCCDKWKEKVRQYDLSPQRFDEALNDVKILKKLLKDFDG